MDFGLLYENNNSTYTVARKVDSAATGRIKTSTEILELSLARLNSSLFLSICNCFMC